MHVEQIFISFKECEESFKLKLSISTVGHSL